MKRLWIALALAALAIGSVWLWAPKDVVQSNSAPAQTTVAAVQAGTSTRDASIAVVDEVARVSTKRRVDAKQRAAYLRRIADGVKRSRNAGEGDAPDANGEGGPAEGVGQEASPGADPDPPGEGSHPIKDKSDGELADLMEAVGNDLMPLIDECYQAASERDPALAGMIDINLELVGDEEVGGIVESFELGEENQIHDEEMIECIRETTLSTLFPAPKDTGRRGARLTLEFGPGDPDLAPE